MIIIVFIIRCDYAQYAINIVVALSVLSWWLIENREQMKSMQNTGSRIITGSLLLIFQIRYSVKITKNEVVPVQNYSLNSQFIKFHLLKHSVSTHYLLVVNLPLHASFCWIPLVYLHNIVIFLHSLSVSTETLKMAFGYLMTPAMHCTAPVNVCRVYRYSSTSQSCEARGHVFGNLPNFRKRILEDKREWICTQNYYYYMT